MESQRNSVPFWLIGVIVALVLILVGQRLSGAGANPVLVDTFRPAPTDASAPTPPGFQLPQVNLPQLPPDAQKALENVRDRFASGQAVPALTPKATGVRASVEVKEVKRAGGNVQVRGNINNIADQPLQVPASAFTFRDSAGVSYTLGGNASTTVQPNQSAPFDLSVPLPEGRGITLIVTLPPDPPIQQTLIVETVGSSS